MEILKFRETRKKWSSMAILKSDLLHGTVHHPTKFQADCWNPYKFIALTPFEADRRTSGRMEQRQYPSVSVVDGGKNIS